MRTIFTTIATCSLLAVFLCVSATGVGAAEAAKPMALDTPEDPFQTTDPPPDESTDAPADEGAGTETEETDLDSLVPGLEALGTSRATRLKHLRYQVACPDVFCVVNVRAKITFGGRSLKLESSPAYIGEDGRRDFKLIVSSADRRAVRRAASRGKSVKVVARAVDWSTEDPQYSDEVTTALR